LMIAAACMHKQCCGNSDCDHNREKIKELMLLRSCFNVSESSYLSQSNKTH
jgi:hypothetical protein